MVEKHAEGKESLQSAQEAQLANELNRMKSPFIQNNPGKRMEHLQEAVRIAYENPELRGGIKDGEVLNKLSEIDALKEEMEKCPDNPNAGDPAVEMVAEDAAILVPYLVKVLTDPEYKNEGDEKFRKAAYNILEDLRYNNRLDDMLGNYPGTNEVDSCLGKRSEFGKYANYDDMYE